MTRTSSRSHRRLLLVAVDSHLVNLSRISHLVNLSRITQSSHHLLIAMLPTMQASLLGALLLFTNNALSLAIQKRFPVSTYAVKESHFVPRSWSRIGAAPADHSIHLRIGLTQGRFAELEKSLYEGKDQIPTCSLFHYLELHSEC